MDRFSYKRESNHSDSYSQSHMFSKSRFCVSDLGYIVAACKRSGGDPFRKKKERRVGEVLNI